MVITIFNRLQDEGLDVLIPQKIKGKVIKMDVIPIEEYGFIVDRGCATYTG